MDKQEKGNCPVCGDPGNYILDKDSCNECGCHWGPPIIDKQLTPEEILRKHVGNTDYISTAPMFKHILAAMEFYTNQQTAPLQSWKDEAMQVLTNLDLQEIGKVIGVKLGTDVSTQVRPAIAALQSRMVELEKLAKSATEMAGEKTISMAKYMLKLEKAESKIAELDREAGEQRGYWHNEKTEYQKTILEHESRITELIGELERCVIKNKTTEFGKYNDKWTAKEMAEEFWQDYKKGLIPPTRKNRK